jgi:hypothetical protein
VRYLFHYCDACGRALLPDRRVICLACEQMLRKAEEGFRLRRAAKRPETRPQ